MSRAAEEAHERMFRAQQERDARDFVLGATVYRVNYHHIEEGKVVKVARCDDPECNRGGSLTGQYAYYAAEFRSEWVAQTYSWKFHANRDDAIKDLLRRLEQSAEDDERTARALRTRIARIRAGDERP